MERSRNGFKRIPGCTVFIYEGLFIQPELEAHYINMWNVKTTSSSSDEASQVFYATEIEILFGFLF